MIGAVARAEDADGVDIDRLVVDPAVHRRGAGRKLVQAVLFRAGHRRATVSTGRANLPARTHAVSGAGIPAVERHRSGAWPLGYTPSAHPVGGSPCGTQRTRMVCGVVRPRTHQAPWSSPRGLARRCGGRSRGRGR
ncbi:GNAT family N-acetyltransferase [Janibacter indicus]|uniref:GNAT family N-acetyltransferase n=1 Tax=Janibacter indicus TaxID=857417 RepID=UPI003D9A0C0D